MTYFTLNIVGSVPLLMHSARLSDPLDPATQALAKVTGKRKKTQEDHAEAARLEHLGSLYLDSEAGPYVPGVNIEACLYRAASRYKLMTALKTALLIPQNVNRLAYKGPRDQDGLWADKAFVHRASVKVGTSRVMRTRPVFYTWGLVAEGSLQTDVVDPKAFEQIVEASGQFVGLGDWRPRFGRFNAEVKWS